MPFEMTAMTQPRLWSDSRLTISDRWHAENDVTLHEGDCRHLFDQLPDGSMQLIVTSPPYNLGKSYEKKTSLEKYLAIEREVIGRCIDKLAPGGSICWQIGNHVCNGEVYPLDILLYGIFKERGLSLRNRIVWHFEHGLHCSKRFSGRYETILWFTKDNSDGSYVFNLDAVRVPQKYPGKKYFKGPKQGQYSGNPLGKNPGDLWVIPNVKHNHPEKTVHPCQFPVELIERLVLALTNKKQYVFDPYMGVGSSLVAAVLNGRRAVGAETKAEYVAIARERIKLAEEGTLPIRPRSRPIYEPPRDSAIAMSPWTSPLTA
jgi:adenine-specific DNA-methyltransferase